MTDIIIKILEYLSQYKIIPQTPIYSHNPISTQWIDI